MKKESKKNGKGFDPKGLLYFIVFALIIGYFFGIPIYFNLKVLYTLFYEQFIVKLSLYMIGVVWSLILALIIFLIMFFVTPLRNIIKQEVGKNIAGKLIYLLLFFLIFIFMPVPMLYLRYALYLQQLPEITRPLIMDFIYNTESFYQSYLYLNLINIGKGILFILTLVVALPYIANLLLERARRLGRVFEDGIVREEPKEIVLEKTHSTITAVILFLALLVFSIFLFFGNVFTFYINNPDYVKFGILSFLQIGWVIESLILIGIGAMNIVVSRDRTELGIMGGISLIALFMPGIVKAALLVVALVFMPTLKSIVDMKFTEANVEDYKKRFFSKRGIIALLVILLIVSPTAAAGVKGFLLERSVAGNPLLNTPYIQREIDSNRWVSYVENVERISVDILPQTEIKNMVVQDFLDENRYLIDRARVWDYVTAYVLARPQLGPRYYLISDTDLFLDPEEKRIYWATYKTIKPETPVTDNFYNRNLFYVGTDDIIIMDSNTRQITNIPSKIYFGEGQLDYVYSNGLEVESVATNSYATNMYLAEDRSTNLGDNLQTLNVDTINISGLILFRLEGYGVWSEYASLDYVPYRSVDERNSIYLPAEFERDLDSYIVLYDNEPYFLTDYNLRLDAGTYMPYVNLDYKRNVARVLTNMETGEVLVYYVGPDDIFKDIYLEIYPWIKDGSEIPAEVRSQLRAPDDYFHYVSDAYTTYHITDPKEYIEATNFYEFDLGDSVGRYTDFIYNIIAKNPKTESYEYAAFLQMILRRAESRELTALMYGYLDDENSEAKFYAIDISAEKITGKRITQEFLNSQYQEEFRLLAETKRQGNMILYPFTYKERTVPLYLLSVYVQRAESVNLWDIVAIDPRSMTFGRGQTVDDALINLFSKITVAPVTPTTPTDGGPVVGPTPTGDKEDLVASLIKIYIQRESLQPGSAEYRRLTEEIVSLLKQLESLEG
ncbi:MAG: UPF0182 family protein [Candidatus Methanofastidiosum sp.]|nr:UPF0182 family protein [Methanofastidiosum sp.]